MIERMSAHRERKGKQWGIVWSRMVCTSLIAAMLGATGPSLFAQASDQEQDPPPSQPGEQSQDEQDAETGETKSLDELLGLEENDDTDSAREAAEREAQEELERALIQREIDSAFKEAVRKMAISAELLGERFDPGLGTQRIQEAIIQKLDELIASARKQQSSSSSSSSSSSQQQARQQQARRQQSNQPSQNQSTGQQPATNSSPRPPGSEQGDFNSLLQESRIEWGSLPPRIRDQLLQSLKEEPSALYRRLTQDYYKRLADEASG